MKLGDLLQTVEAECGGELSVAFLLEHLVVIRGSQFGGDAEPGWLWDNEVRCERLTPQLDLEAEIIRFECIGHHPISLIFFPDSMDDLEAAILSGAGYCNPFTTTMCAFVNGQLRRFQCLYRDDNGCEFAFDKKAQHGFGMPSDRVLRWL